MTADRRRKATASSSGTKSAAKASAKKSTTRKTPAKQTPAKGTPAKKTTTKKVPAKKSAKNLGGSDQPTRRRASAPRAESRPRTSATDVARRAVEQLTQLTGKKAEGVTGIERSDDGWLVTVEVLEVRRVPETTDVLARYEIDTDDNGDLTGYRRAGRYTRGSARED
jgi:hypothetical protein